MNTLFRMAFYVTILLMLFNLGWGFVRGIEGTVFEDASEQNSIDNSTASGVFSELTGLSGSDASLWVLFTGVGLLAAGAVSWMVQSLQPVAIYIFGVGFWSSYNATLNVLTMHNWIPAGMVLMITAVLVFLFVGAIIGMITGNG